MRPVVRLTGRTSGGRLFAPQLAAPDRIIEPHIGDLTCADTVAALATKVLVEAPSGRVDLAGLSMGGIVARAILAAVHERVERLALLDTSHCAEAQSAEHCVRCGWSACAPAGCVRSSRRR